MTDSDYDIKARIREMLHNDSSFDAEGITVEAAGGKVRLSGTVSSLFEKKEAALLAWLVHGVTDVDNRLEVNDTNTENQFSDENIQANAGTALDIDVQTGTINPEISVTNGVVTLSGTVDTLWKLKKAEAIASEIPGVRDVHNLMTVVPTKNITDKVIAEAIASVFRENPYVDEENIFVTVAEGKVTLEGRVLSAKSVMEAYDSASRIIGITNVNNKIVWG